MTTFAQESAAKTQEILLTRFQDELADAKKRQAAANAEVEALEARITSVKGEKPEAVTHAKGKR